MSNNPPTSILAIEINPIYFNIFSSRSVFCRLTWSKTQKARKQRWYKIQEVFVIIFIIFQNMLLILKFLAKLPTFHINKIEVRMKKPMLLLMTTRAGTRTFMNNRIIFSKRFFLLYFFFFKFPCIGLSLIQAIHGTEMMPKNPIMCRMLLNFPKALV